MVPASPASNASPRSAVTRFDSSRLEYDLNKLRRADSWISGAGYGGKKMDPLLGHDLTPTLVLFDNEGETRAAEALVKESPSVLVLLRRRMAR
jgi:hypothetical protein